MTTVSRSKSFFPRKGDRLFCNLLTLVTAATCVPQDEAQAQSWQDILLT
ncbi:MAG: hypothetical protein QNJ54_33300 [Prochloraceae cyanobacterium]|nr:hypothetical protein [Prochloraceae cyanobacterium]